MRGKPERHVFDDVPVRIIPAHAGQTRARYVRDENRTDHPRACGANMFFDTSQVKADGSSPRMRGKRYCGFCLCPIRRIIPAHAGQTLVIRWSNARTSDHPRACGANWRGRNPYPTQQGSSPRMRGKPLKARLHNAALRIIPAHAGQTNQATPDRSRRTDHPRACGANLRRSLRTARMCGSSPRMRGKLHHEQVRVAGSRIIPAHAGQTSARSSSSKEKSDHPRACGANRFIHGVNNTRSGSSPRMRGKLRQYARHKPMSGIIPAHAGQTIQRLIGMYVQQDHPRACGANCLV